MTLLSEVITSFLPSQLLTQSDNCFKTKIVLDTLIGIFFSQGL